MREIEDLDLCQGHAMCELVAPEVVEVPRKDKVTVLDPEHPDALRADVERAVRYCPTQALKILKPTE